MTEKRKRYIIGIVPVLGGAVLLTVFALLTRLQGDVPSYFRDPISLIEGRSIHNGVFSQLGAVLWFSGATITAITATLGWQTRQIPRRILGMLVAISVFGLILGFDDTFMLHESGPIPEERLFVVYGVFAAAIGVIFRRELLQYDWQFGVLAGVLFALSIGVDRQTDLIESLTSENVRIFLEDGCKFLGVAAFWSYCLMLSLAVYSGETS